MEKRERSVQTVAPIVFKIGPEQFWQMLRVSVREEVNHVERLPVRTPADDTPGCRPP